MLLIVAGMWIVTIVWLAVKAFRAHGKTPAIWEVWKQPSRATLIGSYVLDAFLISLVWGVFYLGLISLWVAIAVTVIGIFWTVFFAAVMLKSREAHQGEQTP